MSRRGKVYPYAAEWLASWGAALAVVVLVGTGCSVQASYVESDRLVYDQIANRYVSYTRDDPTLTLSEKDRRERTVVAWDARISSQERDSE